MTVKPATAKDERFGTRAAFGGNDTEIRTAMSSAFEAMSEWRDEMSATAERNSTKVFDKIGAAAKAAGWPDSVVEQTKSNLLQTTKMQTQMMDKVMDAWTEQMKAPGKFSFGNQAFGGQAGKGFGGMSAFTPGTGFPGMPGMDMSKYNFGSDPMAPFQFWMEATQMWQKQWADAVSGMMSNYPGTPPDTSHGRKPPNYR